MPGTPALGKRTPGNRPDDSRYARGRRSSGNSGIYIPGDWGAYWYAKLAAAKAGTGAARVAVVGDSVSVGYYASNLDTTSWVGRLRTAIQSYATDGGSGWKGAYESVTGLSGDSVNSGVYNAWATAGCICTLTGSWIVSTSTYDGPGFSYIRTQSASTTIAYTVRGRYVGVAMLQRTTGTSSCTVQVDGGAAATITFSSGTASDGNYTVAGTASAGIGVYLLDTASTGSHTIIVTNGSASTLDICGFFGYNDTGVIVDKFARGGFSSHAVNNGTAGTSLGSSLAMTASTDAITKSGHGLVAGTQVILTSVTATLAATNAQGNYWVVNPQPATFQIAQTAGGVPIDITADGTCSITALGTSGFVNSVVIAGNNTSVNTFGAPGKWSGGSAWQQPDLVIYSMGLNDAASVQTPLDVFERNVRAYVTDVLGGGSRTGATDLVFLVQHPGTIENNRTIVGLHAEFALRLRALAEHYGAAYVDIGAAIGRNSWNYWNSQSYWGQNATPAGSSGVDGAHLSDTGHQAVANAIFPLLVP